MGLANADLGAQLQATTLGARLWRLEPGQASTRHRHAEQAELYVLLEGAGRMRVGGDLLSLSPLSSVLVEPETVRQLFNDTGEPCLWLILGAPRETLSSGELDEQQLAHFYPDGPGALPPELGG